MKPEATSNRIFFSTALELCEQRKIPHATHVDMRQLTTLRIGGEAPLVCYPETVQQAVQLLTDFEHHHIPWRIMGGGSNLLVQDDRPLPWVIVRLDRLKQINRYPGGRVMVEAGVPAPQLASWAALQGLGGCEFLSGIPGQIGGLTRMNAGAFGRQMADLIQRVWYWTPGTGELQMVSVEPELYGYRRSPFVNGVVLKVELQLVVEEPAMVRQRLQKMKTYRLETQPLSQPSAGCAFKNPVFGRVSAGYLIDRAGLKGRRRGDAVISDKHGNFIINIGNARYQDVVDLIEEARHTVYERFGIRLEPELIFWHDED